MAIIDCEVICVVGATLIYYKNVKSWRCSHSFDVSWLVPTVLTLDRLAYDLAKINEKKHRLAIIMTVIIASVIK